MRAPDCDLWKETRRSKQTLLNPGLLPEGASESFIIYVQSTTGCKFRRNAIMLQFDVSDSDTSAFLGRLQNFENHPSQNLISLIFSPYTASLPSNSRIFKQVSETCMQEMTCALLWGDYLEIERVNSSHLCCQDQRAQSDSNTFCASAPRFGALSLL